MLSDSFGLHEATVDDLSTLIGLGRPGITDVATVVATCLGLYQEATMIEATVATTTATALMACKID
jgi:hypothetical protein